VLDEEQRVAGRRERAHIEVAIQADLVRHLPRMHVENLEVSLPLMGGRPVLGLA
jgi:hypothetical protein